MKLKRVVAGMLTGVMLCGGVVAVPNGISGISEMSVVKAEETKTSKLVYTFANLPINRVIQNFFIDKKNNCIYGTMIRPDKNGKEDTVLIKFEISNKKAKAKSFLIINNGGHGTSLSGYYDNQNLKLYVGSNDGKGITVIDADILNQSGVNDSNINYYDGEVWRNAAGEEIPKKTKVNGVNVARKGASFFDLSKEKRQVTNFGKLCDSGETFDRADFVRASDGKPYVYVRYKKNGTAYLKIVRLATDFDEKVQNQTKETVVSKYKAAVTYNATMSSSINISGMSSWQSEDVYLTKNNNRFFYISTNSTSKNKLAIRRMAVNGVTGRTYIVKGKSNGSKTKEKGKEELEGIYREGTTMYFNHKVQYTDGTKVQTIESITVD